MIEELSTIARSILSGLIPHESTCGIIGYPKRLLQFIFSFVRRNFTCILKNFMSICSSSLEWKYNILYHSQIIMSLRGDQLIQY